MKEPLSGVWSIWKTAANNDLGAERLVNRFVHRPEFEFYDLKKDPWEMNNLAKKAKYQPRIQEMKDLLEAWMQQQGDRGAEVDIPFQVIDYATISKQPHKN